MPSNTSKTNNGNVTSDAVSEVTLVDTYGPAVDSKSGMHLPNYTHYTLHRNSYT